MNKFISALALYFLPLLSMAGTCPAPLPKSFGHATVSTLVGVYDGDSFTVTIDDWPPLIGESIGVRVAGVDTPEIRGKCDAEKALARKARQFTRDALTNAKTISLCNLRRDKYFRILANVYLDGAPLADKLINAKLGYAYEGGKKSGWCK